MLTKKRTRLLYAAALGMLLGCSQTPPAADAATGLQVYKSRGSRQCEAGGYTLAQLQAQLQAAGVRALAASCGNTGLMYAAVCGGADGSIGVFTIAQADAQKAQAAGFVPLATLPDAQVLSCP